MRQVIYIQPARGHVCGDKYLKAALTELAHHEVALCLRQVTVEGVCAISVTYEFVGHFLRFGTCAAEHYGIYVGIVVGDTLQGKVFVLGMDHVVDVIDALCSFVFIAYHYFLGVMQIVFCYLGYGRRHCGREHQRSPVLRDPLEDGIDAVGESHVEHLIGLIHDHFPDGIEADHLAVHQVDQTSRGGDYDMYAALEITDLVFY